MKKPKKLFCVVLLVLGFSFSAQASGFLIYEHGAAAMAMGGAFISLANDPSAIFHNPAGVVWLEGTQVSLGGTLIIPAGSLDLPNWQDPVFRTVDQGSQVFFPPNFYLTHRISDNFSAGIGIFAPYGLGTKWPDDYPLRYIGTSSELKMIFINPMISYKSRGCCEYFSVGFGISAIHSSLSLNLVRNFDLGLWAGDVPVSLGNAKGNGLAFNTGILYKGEKYSLGFTWRSGFKLEYRGDVKFDTSGVPSPFHLAIPSEGKASTTFNFPSVLGVGFSYRLAERLLFTADIQYLVWRTFNQYVVELEFASPAPAKEEETVVENWEDSLTFRGGLQYRLNEKFVIRGGFVVDRTPQPAETMDPNLPDADRFAVTAGFGYSMGHFVIDVAYQYEKFNDRTSPNRNIWVHPVFGNMGEGTYSARAHLFGINFGLFF